MSVPTLRTVLEYASRLGDLLSLVLQMSKGGSMHVINFKEASGRFFFHFLEVLEKCIEYNSFQGDFKILVKSDIF